MITLVVGALLATPALAGTVPLPENCAGVLTVQLRQCVVEHVVQCDDLPAGEKWMFSHIPGGRFAYTRYDRNFSPLERINWVTGEIELPDGPAPDPLNIEELLETGLDTYEANFTSSLNGDTTIKGFDRLTGGEVEIDGRRLQLTEFEYVKTDQSGKVIASYSGNQFLDAELNVIFAGSFTDRLNEAGFSNFSPMDFSLPGEAGFLNDTPRYECGLQDADFPVRQTTETDDDET